jgi:hypothetical protein
VSDNDSDAITVLICRFGVDEFICISKPRLPGLHHFVDEMAVVPLSSAACSGVSIGVTSPSLVASGSKREYKFNSAL